MIRDIGPTEEEMPVLRRIAAHAAWQDPRLRTCPPKHGNPSVRGGGGAGSGPKTGARGTRPRPHGGAETWLTVVRPLRWFRRRSVWP